MDHAPRSARGGASNSQRASITSRPLFIMVAESTEILRPITQFGCAQACVGRHVAQSSRRRASRNGPPDAVSRMRRTPARRRARREAAGRHWKTALCSLSIGSSVAPLSRAARMNSGPAMTSASLFASSTLLPARAAASVGAQAGGADDRGHHGVDLGERARPARAPRAPNSTSVSHASARSRARELARRGASATAPRSAGRMRTALLEQRVRLARARSARRLEAIGMPRDDVERARADRAGGAEDGERLHRGIRQAAQRIESERRQRQRRRSALSMRSSMPPWPGSSCRCP